MLWMEGNPEVTYYKFAMHLQNYGASVQVEMNK